MIALIVSLIIGGALNEKSMNNEEPQSIMDNKNNSGSGDTVTLFLCGDVMTGRGIDQVLPHPVDPVLYESYVKDARRYVKLAESENGPIDSPVSWSYIWGDALDALEKVKPDLRIINLETSITQRDNYWKGKGINYRMHPENVSCLTSAGIDGCTLANNHVLDWGYEGLLETIRSLSKAGIEIAGAGKNIHEAQAPAVFNISDKARVLLFSYGMRTSGIPDEWKADDSKPGINYLNDLSMSAVNRINESIKRVRQKNDIVIFSIHWGGNWGYRIRDDQRQFSQWLIDSADIDIVHGHSSHHPKGIEVYNDRPILYGCGDFINDYEGIGGHEEFRSDLCLMYFISLATSTGKLIRFELVPMRIRKFRLHHASRNDAYWIRDMLDREGAKLGTRVSMGENNRLYVHWD